MSFVVYDLIFLALFLIFMIIFLHRKRKNVKREGILFLYRTKLGIKIIEKFSRHEKMLNFLSYPAIAFGYIAMLWILALLLVTVQIYALVPSLRIFPLVPLVPYVTKAVDIGLPPFYFVYWIIVILIIAGIHEFSHGVYARLYKIKIKSTGFGLLGPFLAAFVEPDEKVLSKRPKKQQLSVLAAGSFSNFLTALLFLAIFHLYIFATYVPAGITGYAYAFEDINVSNIESIGNYSLEEFKSLSEQELKELEKQEQLIVKTGDKTLFLQDIFLAQLQQIHDGSQEQLRGYSDAPAVNANLKGAIKEIDDEKIESVKEFIEVMATKESDQTIRIVTTEQEYEVTLTEHPANASRGYLGILFLQPRGVMALIVPHKLLAPYFSNSINVEPKYNEPLQTFFKDLLFWIFIASFLVSLFNMLPLGFIDGGRFFYLSAWGITRSKKVAEMAFRIVGLIILGIVLILIFIWLGNI